MTDAEKLAIIRNLIDVRADMCEHTIATASKFQRYDTKGGSFYEMYQGKITAANAVSGFCYELLEIIDTIGKEG